MTTDKVKKYIKKPVVIEAYQTDEEKVIHTLEGDMLAMPGDYIITGVNGEQYPCKPDIFDKTYEEYKEEKMHKLSYEKDKGSGLLLLPNFYGFLEDCSVHIDEAGISVIVETYGRVAFIDETGKILSETKIDAKTENDKHSGGFCGIKDGKICVFLNITGLKDTYPNCDGEYDRWVSTIVGYTCIAFDPATETIEESEVESIDSSRNSEV